MRARRIEPWTMLIVRDRGRLARGVSVIAVTALLAATSAAAEGRSAAAAPSSTSDFPAWSPDGKEIAFVVPVRYSFRLELASPSGSSRRTDAYFERMGDAAELRWARSQRLIVATSPNGQLLSVSIATGKRVHLGPYPGGTGSGVGPLSLGADDNFAVSADGNRVAYTGDSPNRNANMDSAGHVPDVFTIGVVASSGGTGRTLPEPINASDAFPSLSPDGSQIVFARSYLTNGIASAPSLMLQSVMGGKVRLLHAQGDRPVWSPNGRWIAYQHMRYDLRGVLPSELRIVSPSGGSRHTLWNPSGHERLALSWSPDSTRIAFVTPSGEMGTATLDGKVLLYKLPKHLSVDGYPNDPPGWSPDGKTLVFAASRDGANQNRVYAITVSGRALRAIG